METMDVETQAFNVFVATTVKFAYVNEVVLVGGPFAGSPITTVGTGTPGGFDGTNHVTNVFAVVEDPVARTVEL